MRFVNNLYVQIIGFDELNHLVLVELVYEKKKIIILNRVDRPFVISYH